MKTVLFFTLLILVVICTTTTFSLAAGDHHILNKLDKGPIQPTCQAIISERYPQHYVAAKTNVPPLIDGDILNDPVWSEPGVEWTSDFQDISTNLLPPLLTKAKIRWDDQHLFVAAILEEPHVNSNITEICHCLNNTQDQVVFHSNDFEVFVDADGSAHYYKETEFSPAAVYWDLCLNKPYAVGGYENSSRVFGKQGFDMFPDVKVAVKILGGGQLNDPAIRNSAWTIEIAFPLHKLLWNTTRESKPPKAGEYWRINFSRVEWAVKIVGNMYWKEPSCSTCACGSNPQTPCVGYPTCDNWVWQPMEVVDIHFPPLWAFLQLADNTTTPKLHSDEWDIRYTAWILWKAQANFASLNNGTYAASVFQLISNTTYTDKPEILSGDCTKAIQIALGDGNTNYVASIESKTVSGMVANINDQMKLTVSRN